MEGYKFDLRIYILVTSCDPLRIFLYNDGLVRMGTEKYHAPSEANLVRRTLTVVDTYLLVTVKLFLPVCQCQIQCLNHSYLHVLLSGKLLWAQTEKSTRKKVIYKLSLKHASALIDRQQCTNVGNLCLCSLELAVTQLLEWSSSSRMVGSLIPQFGDMWKCPWARH